MDRQLQGELETIKEKLVAYYASDANKADQTLTQFVTDPLSLETTHRILKQVVSYQEKGKSPSLLAVPDLNDAFHKLAKGMALTIPEFLGFKALLLAGDQIFDKFAHDDTVPDLKDLALDFVQMPDFERTLDMSFGPDGEVLDTASGTLLGIRKELRAIAAKEAGVMAGAKSKYKSYLALPDPVLRSGTETLAVSTANKGFVPGIVVDRSNTGETLFVIPYEVLELENKKEKLRADELNEIDHILSELSKSFAGRYPQLDRNYYSYNVLDSYVAKAMFGSSYDGMVATTSQTALDLEEFIHPLIDLSKAVPNSVILGGNNPRILIVSGPNAGGKSVLLKALALSCFMNQMGLLVPARKKALLPVFDGIFVLTGDSESLSGNLSSFSGHLKGLKEMYQAATARSFVLVDEIGQGTSPEDGEAIGFAFIKHMEALKAFGVFTTHYDGLKKLAVEDKGILSGAMEFSAKTLGPTFRFLQGAVGNSYAFEVAKKNGMPEALIEAAKAYKHAQKAFDSEALEQELTAKIQKANEDEKRLNDKLFEANRLLEKRTRALEALAQEKDAIAKKADEKVEAAARERIQALDRIWNAGKAKDLPFNERSRLKGELKKAANIIETNPKVQKALSYQPTLSVGDLVVYQNMTGTLEAMDKKKARISYNGMTLTVPLKDLRKSTAQSLPTSYVNKGSAVDQDLMTRASRVQTRLNVIGCTVSEAIPQVERFLDDALLTGLKTVTIVHGMGTFALRNGIWAFLKKQKFVQSFREGGETEGMLGATVVTLK